MKKIFLLFLIISLNSFAIFRAGDVVFIPAVCYEVDGANGSFWNTDIYITNPSEGALFINLEFLPSGMEGRTDETRIYKQLTESMVAYQTMIIKDVIKTHFSDVVSPDSFGALIIYGKDVQGKAKSFIASSRTYTYVDKEDPTKGTYGQYIPGIPWYYYIDPVYKDSKLDQHWLYGLTQMDDVHTNVGFVSGTTYKTIDIGLELYNAGGTLVGTKQIIKGLGPLGHFQINYFLKEKYGLTDVDGYSLKVTIEDYSPKDSSGSPALYIYGSKVYGKTNEDGSISGTNDPIYIEATYPVDLNYNCVWP